MYELDSQSTADLLVIYEAAADEVRAHLHHVADAGNTIPAYQLQQLLRQIEAVIDELGKQRDQLLGMVIDQAALLGMQPFTAQGVLADMADEPENRARFQVRRLVEMRLIYPDGTRTAMATKAVMKFMFGRLS